jgi:hypothetical protein
MYWFYDVLSLTAVRGGATGQGTALQAEGGVFDGVIEIFRPRYDPGVDSASNRNEYQKFLLGVNVDGAYSWQPCHLHVPTL